MWLPAVGKLGGSDAGSFDAGTVDAGGADAGRDGGGGFPIEHEIVLVKENHTFDNYFGSFPGAEGTSTDQPAWTRISVENRTTVVNASEFEKDIAAGHAAQRGLARGSGRCRRAPARRQPVHGENWTVQKINALMQSPYRSTSVVLITWTTSAAGTTTCRRRAHYDCNRQPCVSGCRSSW